MSKTALSEAMKKLDNQEQETVRKLWRIQKQIEEEARRMRRRHIVRF
jgi:Na+/phosphate symporter